MVKKGDYVLIHYTGYFENGDVFDTSRDGQPFEFQAGSGSVIPGFDNAVMGMNPSEKKDIIIEPSDGYGSYDDSLICRVPTDEFRQSVEPEVGMQIALQLDNGSHMPAEITDVNDENVTLDMNHPLAGKTLKFNIEIIEINSTPKHPQGCDCSSGCCDHSGCSC